MSFSLHPSFLCGKPSHSLVTPVPGGWAEAQFIKDVHCKSLSYSLDSLASSALSPVSRSHSPAVVGKGVINTCITEE